MREDGSRRASRYWCLQALAVASWWLWLWLQPAARVWFGFGPWPDEVLMAFAVPDLLLLVGGSLVAAAARGAVQTAAAWLLVGAAGYATLWCLSAAALNGHGWLGGGLMAACTVANLTAACTVCGSTSLKRPSP
ncbi:MAG: hypothetical protein RL398_315 [Planctomycetota bacterium]|jgi:hypothetical protein